jgi:hypothetical protein
MAQVTIKRKPITPLRLTPKPAPLPPAEAVKTAPKEVLALPILDSEAKSTAAPPRTPGREHEVTRPHPAWIDTQLKHLLAAQSTATLVIIRAGPMSLTGGCSGAAGAASAWL